MNEGYMLLLLFAIVAVLTVCSLLSRNTATLENFTSKDEENCLADAVDKNIPVFPGALTPVTPAAGEVESALACALTLINTRCASDWFLLSVDDATKAVDAVGNMQMSGEVHVFSRQKNVSATLVVKTLQGAQQKTPYVSSAAMLTPSSQDTSGVEAAPAGIFQNRSYYTLDTFAGDV